MKTKHTAYRTYRHRISLPLPDLPAWKWEVIERALKNAFDAGVRHGRKK